MRKKVLVLGSNFGGLTAALAVKHELHGDVDVQVIGDTAVVTFRFEMMYEREKDKREHSTGRDLWIFARDGDQWLAVWRTMLDVVDEVVH